MRRTGTKLLLTALGFLTIGVLLIPGRATASQGLSIVHEPPAIAMTQANLEIDALVASHCTMFCGPVDLAVHYVSPSGIVGTVGAEAWGIAHVFRLIIPADQLRTPWVSYWLEARQTHCAWIGRCQVSSARAPDSGTFVVPVETMP